MPRALKVVNPLVQKKPGGRPPITGPRPVVEKGVPMPEQALLLQFPFDAMEIGDSFFVACQLDRVSMTSRIRSRFRYWKMKQCPRVAMTISVQRVDGGLRCWRMS
jgi:hypothetical protein